MLIRAFGAEGAPALAVNHLDILNLFQRHNMFVSLQSLMCGNNFTAGHFAEGRHRKFRREEKYNGPPDTSGPGSSVCLLVLRPNIPAGEAFSAIISAEGKPGKQVPNYPMPLKAV